MIGDHCVVWYLNARVGEGTHYSLKKRHRFLSERLTWINWPFINIQNQSLSLSYAVHIR